MSENAEILGYDRELSSILVMEKIDTGISALPPPPMLSITGISALGISAHWHFGALEFRRAGISARMVHEIQGRGAD